MESGSLSFKERSLAQQGYRYGPEELKKIDWGLRFTPAVCMFVAVSGLVTQQPAIHFALALLGILWFWIPAWHPFDIIYNNAIRPMWNGVKLPPNPLPRRIACFIGGSMNLGIGAAFTWNSPTAAYLLGAILIPLQIIVIATHFCAASWMYEVALRLMGEWTPRVPLEKAKEMLSSGGILIDVRTPVDFARGHLPGAMNVPLDQIRDNLDDFRGRHSIICCEAGLQSRRAVRLLEKECVDKALDLGPMSRWRS